MTDPLRKDLTLDPFPVGLYRCPNGHEEVSEPDFNLGGFPKCARCKEYLWFVGNFMLRPIP